MSGIDQKYTELEGKRGFLGKPKSPERWCNDHVGRHRSYEGGHIFWHPDTEAYEVHGAIMTKYKSWGWEKGALGYPLSDEMDSPDGGRFNYFQKGLIVWTPETMAHGICEDGKNIDYMVDFEQLYNTPYGNLKRFYELMRYEHKIDLKYDKKYRGWQVADFWNGNYELNGRKLSTGERLIITVAQILLMQWNLRDLKNHSETRRREINRYFNKKHCFKRNYSLRRMAWSYNAWCSEFVSYVYRRAGIPVSLNKKQTFFCKGVGRYEKIGWCMSRVSYFRGYFGDTHRYKSMVEYRANNISPQLGNYLCSKEHSMLILWTDEKNKRIYIVNGNAGSGSPQGSNKLVKFEWKDIDNKNLTGIGNKNVSFPF